jgi:taurine transport system permease protein
MTFVSIEPSLASAEAPGRRDPGPESVTGRSRALLTKVGLPLLSLAVFGAAWQLVVSLKIWNRTLVPPPETVWRAFLRISSTVDGTRGYSGKLLYEHFLISIERIAYGAGLGILLGIGFGLLMGLVPVLRSLFDPWVTFLRALPPLAYFSLLIIWLGIEEAPKITLLAVAAFPPVAVAATAGVLGAPTSLLEAGRALGASRLTVIRDVVIPAALPETITGIRLAVGVAYSSLVAAELVNGLPGIGGMVRDAANYNNTPVVVVGIIVIGVSGLVIDGLLQLLERRLVPWRGKA